MMKQSYSLDNSFISFLRLWKEAAFSLNKYSYKDSHRTKNSAYAKVCYVLSWNYVGTYYMRCTTIFTSKLPIHTYNPEDTVI